MGSPPAENRPAKPGESLEALLDGVQDVVFRLRVQPELGVEYVSPSVEAITGYRPDEWYADPQLVLRVIDPEYRGELDQALSGSGPARHVTRWQRRDGTYVWFETVHRVEHDDQGHAVVIEGVGRDITERLAAEEQARQSRALFEAMFLQSPVGMALTSMDADKADRLLEVNPALCEMLGRTRDELLARPISDFTHPDDRDVAVDLKRRTIGGALSGFEVEKRYLRPDGSIIWGQLHGSLLRDRDGSALYGVGHVVDVTERRAYEESLRHRALHDLLTNLPNRELFLDRLERALVRPAADEYVGVLFADIDDLKAINDRYGHTAGDAAIRELAARFERTVAAGDTVARFSGDELTVLSPELPDAAAAHDLGCRLIDALQEPFELEQGRVDLRASIGVAVAQPGTESADELIADAEVALLKAKQAGRGRVELFSEHLGAAIRARRAHEDDVRAAAEQGQFELHYQPIVSLRRGHVIALEALVRWRHPTRGLRAPAEFVQIAERLGLIDQVGRWVIERACREVAAKADAVPDGVRVSVNVSPREVASGRLVRDVADILEQTSCDPTALCFEVTETGLMEDPLAAARTLRGLKELGIVVALDDFGTGFSSLSHLAALPVDIVKLDRSFASDLHDARRLALVRAIHSMAHSLGMELIAEGIETDAQRERLVELGCRIGQGFLLGRPAPVEELQTTLTRNDGSLVAAAAVPHST